jgi:DMSO/TMAO reductase YedYZ molybdopterin-dependent catalytic subunit
MTSRRVFFLAFGVAVFLALTGPRTAAQSVPKPDVGPKAATQTGTSVAIRVSGEVAHPLSLTHEELGKLPRQSVQAKGHDGVESQYEGVALPTILARAGVPAGKDLRGPSMALYVVVEATDGYRAVFALAELDSAFTDRVVLLADRRDGKPLSCGSTSGLAKATRWLDLGPRLTDSLRAANLSGDPL